MGEGKRYAVQGREQVETTSLNRHKSKTDQKKRNKKHFFMTRILFLYRRRQR